MNVALEGAEFRGLEERRSEDGMALQDAVRILRTHAREVLRNARAPTGDKHKLAADYRDLAEVARAPADEPVQDIQLHGIVGFRH